MLIQRVTTAEDVEIAVSAIGKWGNRLSWYCRDAQLLPFRLAAAKLFSEAWDSVHGHPFLNFDEKNVFVIQKHLPLTFMDPDQLQRLANTTRANVVSLLYGKLLEANVLTSADIVVACEMLLEHYNMHGYMQGATILRMLSIQRKLRNAKRHSNLYEVEHYADIINQLIQDFILVQVKKAKDARPKGEKEKRRRAQVTQGQPRISKTLTYIELVVLPV
ncbi:hypothetical protein EW145_g7827 [Phellinidium pouzarii]|uniref:Uncharacterized protein n=1 Tax=Phellinidium pouzarii TaxID=167371 RepID=A0A4V3XA02_9AGAM|nr:hypothetical protein EW145_g7827 [Phellinidium pouzarii]